MITQAKHLLTCAEESMKHNVFLPVEEEYRLVVRGTVKP